jgi:hypothetical protein
MVLTLPRGIRVVELADGCRAAALDFVNRVSKRADTAMLDDWLQGAYAALVIRMTPSRTLREGATSLFPPALNEQLGKTREAILQEFELARDPVQGAAFGYAALAAGLLNPCRDGEGHQGWVPVALPRMSLVDRVRSLVAADTMLRAEDYEKALFACSRCGVMSFDATRIEGRMCEAHEGDTPSLTQPPPSRRALAG